MEDVSGDDHIGLVGLQSLRGGILFHVEELVFEEGILGEVLFGLLEEERAHIGEDVVGALFGQEGEDLAGGDTGTGPCFDEAQLAILGKLVHEFADGSGEDAVVELVVL